jgi:hypothetical protein
VTNAGLGYLFWHAPPVGADRGEYEAALVDWQDALVAHPPPGYRRGWTWRLAVPPWLVGWPDEVYLDGYVVADFTALGALNADAPSGPLAPAHHSAARRAAYGAGALFACRTGTAGPDPGTPDPGTPGTPGTPGNPDPTGEAGTTTVHLSWHDKAPGTSYDEMVGALSGEGRSVWLRQLVLGAGPELVVVNRPDDALPSAVWQASAVRLTR